MLLLVAGMQLYLSEIWFKRVFFDCRQFTDSATGKHAGGSVTSVTNKFLRSINNFKKAKMSMQNQWKLISQLKDYLSKTNLDKNQQIIVTKDWLDSLQKLTYSQLETIRKLSSSRSDKTTDTSKNSNAKHDLESDVKLTLMSAESLADPDSKTEQPKTQQVIVYKLDEIIIIIYVLFVRKVNFFQQQIHEQGTPDKAESKDGITMLQILSTLLPKLSPKVTQSVIIPKWKVNIHSNIPKHSIISRTRHVLNSIVSAESNASKLRRLEDLLLHVDQYPEARHYAIKEGAIRILLRLRQKTEDEQIKGIQEENINFE